MEEYCCQCGQYKENAFDDSWVEVRDEFGQLTGRIICGSCDNMSYTERIEDAMRKSSDILFGKSRDTE